MESVLTMSGVTFLQGFLTEIVRGYVEEECGLNHILCTLPFSLSFFVEQRDGDTL